MATWEAENKRKEVYIRTYTRKFYSVLMSQLNGALKWIESIETIEGFRLLPAFVDNEKLKEIFIDLYRNVGRREMPHFPLEGIKAFNPDTMLKNYDKDLFMDEMQQYAEQQVGMKIVWINDYTKKIVGDIVEYEIASGLEKGLGIDEIARNMKKSVKKEFMQLSRKRAKTIAQTEVMSASNTAFFNLGSNLDFPVVKRWITAPAGIAKTERHTKLEPELGEQRPELNQPFIVDGEEMLHPGSGSAENVINCRCAFSLIPKNFNVV